MTSKKCDKPSLESWSYFMKSVWLEATNAEGSDQPKEDANLILCGGDSMSAVKMFNEVQDHFGREFPRLLDILLNHTWEDVCEYVQQELRNISPKKSIEIYQRNMMSNPSKGATTPTQSILQLAWKFDTKKCVDASPLAVDRYQFTISISLC